MTDAELSKLILSAAVLGSVVQFVAARGLRRDEVLGQVEVEPHALERLVRRLSQ
jgi:predicted membrane protein